MRCRTSQFYPNICPNMMPNSCKFDDCSTSILHPIRLDIDDNLKKGDRIHLKAKNVEIRKNNTIKYDSLKGKQAFQYEKVNE